MEETANTNAVVEDNAPPKMGAILRENRLRLGMSVADVSAQIRLAPRQIEALEADDFAHLPEQPFLRGFVRSYAKLLHLDAETLLAALPVAKNASERIEPVSVEVPFSVKQMSAQQNKVWLIASAVVLLLAIVFAIWHFNTPQTAPVASVEKSDVSESVIVLPEQNAAVSSVEEVNAGIDPDAPVSAVPPVAPSVIAPVAASLVVAPAPVKVIAPALKTATVLAQSAVPVSKAVSSVAAVTSAEKSKLRLTFDKESWTEVKDANSKILSAQLNAAGSELNLNGSAPYELVIGNAKAVHVFRNGAPVDVAAHINASSEVARLTVK